jgi:hypothetical protein
LKVQVIISVELQTNSDRCFAYISCFFWHSFIVRQRAPESEGF